MDGNKFSEVVDIYPVTGRKLFLGRASDAEAIAQLAAGGARIVQLREKGLCDLEFYRLAVLYREETRKHGMMLIINDRVDIALACGADGVHLGLGDMPIPEARSILGPDAVIGGSSHTVEQAMEAEAQGASYVNIGPLFATATKPGVPGIGLEPLCLVMERVKIPVTCMGGITERNICQVVLAGARYVGVVGAIFGARDMAGVTARFASVIRGAGKIMK